MIPFSNLVPILLLFLVAFPCTCHPTLSRNRSNNIQCIDTERDALLRFKHGLTNDFCGLLASWGPNTDCCQWRGVSCSNLTGHVVMIDLVGGYSEFDTCLEGKVSPSLGELKHLTHLNLSNNMFDGEIPHQFGNLSKLESLDLQYSYARVRVKSLSWISRLTLLKYLDLSYADLSEVTNWMAIVENLYSLSVLRMDNCQLPVKIPLSLSHLNFSTTLHTISLSKNYFNDSSLFRWLFNLPRLSTQLIYLDLSSNAFQVPIPSEFQNFHSLSYLSLSKNAFQGSVSKIVSKLCNLRHLHLRDNNFTDELSNVIHSLVNCNNKALLTLDLSLNGFWGAIPDGIGSFSSLKELHLNGNQLKGEIGQGIGQLTMLEKLVVSSNSFEGTLNHSLFLNLANLRELYLSDNLRLVVNISDKWIPQSQLDVISLRSCKLGPRFPNWLKFQTNFSYFDISNTGISDSIPISFWNSLPSNLQYLNMSNNHFYGILPNLPDIPNAIAIDLSVNLFEGIVPLGFTNLIYLYLNDNRFSDCSNILCPKIMSGLSRLDLSSNLFSGQLPNCWMKFVQLSSLHLENNNFSGGFPESFGTLSNLQYLHLHNNSFSGPFPPAFKSFTSLMILNLGYNFLYGYIPPWIGNSSQRLGVLILRKNHFIGEIPESICLLNHLQILDLAMNHIIGVIPNCIGNFTAMEKITNFGLHFNPDLIDISNSLGTETETKTETAIVSWKKEEQTFKETVKWIKSIDLSGNKLRGEIPNEISILNGLVSLDLSKNKLSGNIPLKIGNLTALELLNMSFNHLTGEIPTSLAKVSYLGTLDVSYNNLSGEIPVSTQLQTFDASSYVGNPGLCGAPLVSCSKNRAPSNVFNGEITSVVGKDEDFVFFLGLYISVALGFIIGFWGVFGTLVIKTSWRHAYFRILDNIKDKIR